MSEEQETDKEYNEWLRIQGYEGWWPKDSTNEKSKNG